MGDMELQLRRDALLRRRNYVQSKVPKGLKTFRLFSMGSGFQKGAIRFIK